MNLEKCVLEEKNESNQKNIYLRKMDIKLIFLTNPQVRKMKSAEVN